MLGRLEEISGARALRWRAGDPGRRLATGAALAGAMFALCRAGAISTTFAMGMALFAAALAAGMSALGPLAGCAAGALSGGISPLDSSALIGAGAILAGEAVHALAGERLRLAMDRSERALLRADWLPEGLRRRLARRRSPSRLARSPNRSRCAVLAGLGALAPGLAAADGPLRLAQALAAGTAAFAAAPLLLDALGVRWGRRSLTDGEKTGLLLAAAALLAGLARLWMPLALALGGAAVLLTGSGGAVCGIALGAALALARGDARPLAALACGGAAVQLRRGSRTALGGLVMAGALALQGLPWPWVAGAGASAALALAAPERARASLAAWCAREEVCPERLARCVAERTHRRLRALGEVFGDLAGSYARAAPPRDEQALMQRLRDALCAGCPGFQACWTEAGGGARFLCELIALAAESEAPPEEVPPGLSRLCRRAGRLPEPARTMLEDFALTRRSERDRGAENRRIGSRFGLAQRLLEEVTARDGGLRFSGERSRRAGAALERAGLPVGRVISMSAGGEEVIAALRTGVWTGESARRATAAAASALGWPGARARIRGRELTLTRLPGLRVSAGAACAARREDEPCGDSFALRRLEGGRLLALICDGMGSGAAAAEESAAAVALTLRLLRAGAGAALAVEAVNALLANRQAGDMFATADMLTVDLDTGEAELTKLAACPTLLMRRGEAHWASGGRLPLGILERVEPACLRARLIPGDVLVMASDGVAEALDGAAMAALVRAHRGGMQALADSLLSAALSGAGGHRDDMTVLCLRLESRRAGGSARG